MGAWLVIYIRGKSANTELLDTIEDQIQEALKPHASEVNRVQIRPDEYEYRCSPTGKNIRILTLHLKLVTRSFIIQWIINLFYKERERLFVGLKFGGHQGEEDPAYRFDLVPYRKKTFISQRFDTFIEMDDIQTLDKSVDNRFMIKSESQAYVDQFVDNHEFVKLISDMENIIEHLTIHKSKEETDPHLSITYEFFGLKHDHSISDMIKLFFLTAQLHISNHDRVKKKVAQGSKGKSMTSRRGAAKTGAGRSKKRSKKQRK